MTDERRLEGADVREADVVAHMLDTLEPDERAAVELLLSSDEGAASEARSWSETLARFAEASSVLTSPAETTRARVLAAIRPRQTAEIAVPHAVAPVVADEEEETLGAATSARPGMLGFLAMAAAVAALMLGVAAFWRQSIADRRVEALTAEREQLLQLLGETRSRVDVLGEAVGRLDSAVRTMSFPARQSIVLAGLESAPQASGVTHVRSDNQSAVFQAFGLPQLSPERTYQLWYIGAAGPVSGGIFEVDVGGDATIEVSGLPPSSEIAAWAVTVEPAGGVPAPTGAMVLRG